jgi:hypothetical protein
MPSVLALRLVSINTADKRAFTLPVRTEVISPLNRAR